MDFVLPYLAGIGCSFCYGIATILEQVAAKRQQPIGSLHPSHLIGLARQGPYIFGIVLDTVGWLLFLVAARKLPLFLALSFVVASLVVSAVLAHMYLSIRESNRERFAIISMIIGLVLLGAAAQPSTSHTSSQTFWVAIVCAPLFIGTCGLILLKISQHTFSTFGLAALAGLAFGGTGLVVRVIYPRYITPHTVLLLVALILYGLLGALFMAAALQRDSVNRVNGVLYASELVIPSFLGIVFLGDSAKKGLWPILLLGFVCVVLSVITIVVDSRATTKGS